MSEIAQFSIKTERTARVAQLGTLSEEVTDVWIVLHGYQMLARRFIKRFSSLANEQSLVVAPEGLSRFYLPGHKYVGASWMTKEDRLNEIEDQWKYLNKVQAHLGAQLSPAVRWHLLGFSQGCATLWRWMLNGAPKANSLTIWTGGIPEESSSTLESRLQALPLCYVYASNDEFVPEKMAKGYGETLQKRYPQLKMYRFEGKHEVLEAPLAQVQQHILSHC